MADLIAGKMEMTSNGEVVNCVGGFTLNLGQPKREMLVGPDRIHGYKELPQPPSVSGEIRDSDSLNVTNAILNMDGATLVFTVANGKQYMFENAVYTGDGNIETDEGKIQFEAQAMSGTEI
jgi:hypothetical protein